MNMKKGLALILSATMMLSGYMNVLAEETSDNTGTETAVTHTGNETTGTETQTSEPVGIESSTVNEQQSEESQPSENDGEIQEPSELSQREQIEEKARQLPTVEVMEAELAAVKAEDSSLSVQTAADRVLTPYRQAADQILNDYNALEEADRKVFDADLLERLNQLQTYFSDQNQADEGPAENTSINEPSVSETVSEAVAEVGDVNYETIDEAIEKAESGQTIRLLKPFTLSSALVISGGKTLTLDLNDQTVTVAGVTGPAITVTGSLTIKDTGASGKGIVTSAEKAQILLIENSGSFTLQSGSLVNTLSSGGTHAVMNNGHFEISGGQIKADYAAAVMNQELAGSDKPVICNIYGGELLGGYYGIGVLGKGIHKEGQPDVSLLDNTSLVVTIDGGRIATQLEDSQGIATNASNGKYAGFTINIRNGEIVADNDGCGIYLPALGIINLSGGKVYGGNQGVRIAAGILNMTGGTVESNQARKDHDNDLISGGSGGTAGAIVAGKAGGGYVGNLDIRISGGSVRNSADGAKDAIIISDINMNNSAYRLNTLMAEVSGGVLEGDFSRISPNKESDGGQIFAALKGGELKGIVNNESRGSIFVQGSLAESVTVNNTGKGFIAVEKDNLIQNDIVPGKTLLAEEPKPEQADRIKAEIIDSYSELFDGKTIAVTEIQLRDNLSGETIHDQAVTFMIPYPDEITAENYQDYSFAVLHLNHEGKSELAAYEVLPNGLKVNSTLSTFAIGYQKVKKTEPTPEPTPDPEPQKPANSSAASWDDGGPFTEDACGSIYDRWGNQIYKAETCRVRVSGGYVVPNTGVNE